MVSFHFRHRIFVSNLHPGKVNFMWPTVTAHCSYPSLLYKSFAGVRFNLPLVFSTIRGRRQLPGNDCLTHNRFMFHFPSKLSSAVRQINFLVAETLRAASVCGPPGTPMQMFSYSFWLLVSFSDKTKTNEHPVRQEAKQLTGEEWHKDTESEGELLISILFQNENVTVEWIHGQQRSHYIYWSSVYSWLTK